MISKKELTEIAKKTGLPLYQQEKDYLLKLFLFNYFKRFDDAILKGGTCIKYLFGANRFSEDLDFNITSPERFKKQVRIVLKQIELIGIKNHIKKEETFENAYTVEISFQGPLFVKGKFSSNKFRIDAGYRSGTIRKPEWKMISSEYAETTSNFLIKSMNEEEMLAEKFLAVFERKKGRDLFDAWFLIKKGVKLDKKLIEKKMKKLNKNIEINLSKIVSEKEYERDISKLSKTIVPYKQIVNELKHAMKIHSIN